MLLLRNTKQLKPKQELKLLNVLFLFVVFIHKDMQFQE